MARLLKRQPLGVVFRLGVLQGATCCQCRPTATGFTKAQWQRQLEKARSTSHSFVDIWLLFLGLIFRKFEESTTSKSFLWAVQWLQKHAGSQSGRMCGGTSWAGPKGFRLLGRFESQLGGLEGHGRGFSTVSFVLQTSIKWKNVVLFDR